MKKCLNCGFKLPKSPRKKRTIARLEEENRQLQIALDGYVELEKLRKLTGRHWSHPGTTPIFELQTIIESPTVPSRGSNKRGKRV